MSKEQAPRRHHYVPQFYLRNFCCEDDRNKVPTISRHNPFLIKKRSSIGRIGYEDHLYRITDRGVDYCVEEKLNKTIETPFSQSKIWEKIQFGKPEMLTESDKFAIYIFLRHLEARNIEVLEFIKTEQKKFSDPKYRDEYSDLERVMHKSLSSVSDGAERFYMGMSSNIEQYFDAFKNASISILGSNIPLRTSTNPVVNVPVHLFQNKEFDPNALTKWFPLTPWVGVLLHMNKNYFDFSEFKLVGNDVVRTLNRLYLVQLLESKTTKHMIANDEYIIEDFEWAGVEFDSKNPRKFRIPG